jgi:hypothetical protein
MKRGSVTGILPTMRRSFLVALAACALATIGVSGQSAAVADTSKLGPQIGSTAPALTGVDQFGKPHTLSSTYGPKGAMLVFFRSADW